MGLLDSILEPILGPAPPTAGERARSVGRSYGLLQDHMMKSEQANKDEYYKLAKDKQKQAGLLGAKNRAQAAYAGEEIPAIQKPTAIPDYKGPSELERWKKQIDMMIQSGVPELQEEAFGQMSNYRQRATANAPKAATPYRFSGGVEGSPKMRQQYEMQSGQAVPLGPAWETGGGVNVNLPKNDQYAPVNVLDNLVDKDGNKVKLPYGTTNRQIEAKGLFYQKETTADKKDVKSAIKAGGIASEMEGMLFGEGGIYEGVGDSIADRAKFAAISNLQQFTQTDPKYRMYAQYAEGTLSPLVKSLGEVGALAEGDVQRASALTPTITGLNPDSPKVAREKLKKLNRLIELGQKAGKIDKAILDSVLGPRKEGETWEEDGLTKRMGPNGKIQIKRTK